MDFYGGENFAAMFSGKSVGGTVGRCISGDFCGSAVFCPAGRSYYYSRKTSSMAGICPGSFWMYQILAMKCLKIEALKVYDALTHQNIAPGRQRLSWLVGRDTANLSEEEIVKATVETVAENTTDGVIAPMLFMAIGGAPLGFAYKAVNTLDSMVGYRNDKYRYFGTASARADDVVNFIPARLAGLLMVLAAFFCRYDAAGAWRCFVRDRNKHLSPNSAQTESACAGALGIQLGGTHDYFGKPVEKPTLGDEKRQG